MSDPRRGREERVGLISNVRPKMRASPVEAHYLSGIRTTSAGTARTEAINFRTGMGGAG
jgi:hypothetical protein